VSCAKKFPDDPNVTLISVSGTVFWNSSKMPGKANCKSDAAAIEIE
jgi:hypothetical protein